MKDGLKGKDVTGLVMLSKNGKVIRTKSFGSKATRKIIVLSWLPLINYIDEFQLIIRLNEQQ